MMGDSLHITTDLIAAAAAILPMVAFAAIMLFLRRRPKLSAAVSIGAVTCSLAATIWLLVAGWHAGAPQVHMWRWMQSSTLTIPVGILLDPLSLLMSVIVCTISFLVQVYSLGYMAGDPGFSRYYAFMSLFAWAMISLTLSPTLLQLYIFWELVGLASYLLIGFWHEKFSASEAGKKAFVMTRVGDVAFLLGLLLVLQHLGNLDILQVNGPSVTAHMSASMITLAALLIFGGIVGKSAQFPLLTWLPDAMEGPTPVSALLHSATMVAAGVYLFARLFPFMQLSPTAMSVFLFIGTLSMLLASTMAMVARDIKQVWAYSTISQLGFMIMALGAGSYVAGVFHLTTHAAFKALLFLCAGAFIHTFHTNDMTEIGEKGGRQLTVPMICMVIGAAALAGVPPFSGFFSKELIMAALMGLHNPVWIVAGLVGAFLTAYYTFRLVFIIWFPIRLDTPPASAEEDGHGDARHDRAMYGPLIVLAALTLGLGFAEHGIEGFLAPAMETAGPGGTWLMVIAIACSGGGLVLAWFEFGRPGAPRKGFVEHVPALTALFAERWYIDRFYRWMLDKFVYGVLSFACAKNDEVIIDGGVDGLGKSAVAAGGGLSRIQMSMIQYKLLVIFAVLALLALYMFF